MELNSGVVALRLLSTAAVMDPLSMWADEREKEVQQRPVEMARKQPDTLSSLFSDIVSEGRGALSPLMKMGADYLLASSQSPTASSSSSTTDLNMFEGDEFVSSSSRDSGAGAAPAAVDDDIPLLSGEQKLMSLKDAYIQVSPGRLLPGTLFMTNYRVAFVPSPSYLVILATTNPSIYSWLNVPLASIDRVEKEKRMKDARGAGVTIVITCKDVRQHRITTSVGEYEVDRAFSTMSAYAFPNNMRHLFAFSHSMSPPSSSSSSSSTTLSSSGSPYDAVQEYSRQGIIDVVSNSDSAGEMAYDSSLWRMSTANKDYRLCKTYPQYMVMPRGLSDEELFLVAGFRSGRRLPTMSWGDKDSGASMWRSAQPKAGVSGSCAQDEKFLEMLSQSCVFKRDPLGNKKVVADPILHIVDCRPRSSAMANRATGAGYESQTNYPYVRLEFYNIGNIHVMRDSLKSLISLVLAPSPPSGDIHFSRLVEDTQWLVHLRLIIKAAWDTASFLRRGMPVLVHCSHGWDRTAQVCSLAQLFLDSHYRTIDGFKVLVEKEWISFGHPFEMRCAHSQPRASRQEDQMAPVFLQFLDCVWQIMRQQQHFFEFNTRYLLTLADHIYSCRFGTFLFNSDLDRVSSALYLSSLSLFIVIFSYPTLHRTPTSRATVWISGPTSMPTAPPLRVLST